MKFCPLPQRSLVRVAGKDASAFLQSFSSVDVRKASSDKLLFGAFLNPKGRILHDFFLHKLDGDGAATGADNNSADSSTAFDLETPTGSTPDLVAYLKKFKFRKKVDISIDANRKVFAVWPGAAALTGAFADPRFPQGLPHRFWASAPPSSSSSSRAGGGEKEQALQVSTNEYHDERIKLGFAEGDEESFEKVPFLLNYDYIPHALTYDKGCYTGQELIARTHFKGQVRTRILPVEIQGEGNIAVGDSIVNSEANQDNEDSVGDGTLIALAPGNARLGLASFKNAHVVAAANGPATHEIKGVKVRLIRPIWWPATGSGI